MALRIYETDPDAAPKPKRSFASDTVGRFRAGRLVGKKPESLDEWRVTTGDPEVASAIVQLFGGVSKEWETTGEDGLEILTTTKAVDVIIDNPRAIQADMRQYSNNNLFHHCDGVEFLSPEERKGTACGCPAALRDRKAHAKMGGPKPNIDIKFRLYEDPDLGYFRLVTGSWDLVRDLGELTTALEDVGGPAKCELRIDKVSFEAKSGPRAGTTVEYNRPAIEVVEAFRGVPSLAKREDDEPPF